MRIGSSLRTIAAAAVSAAVVLVVATVALSFGAVLVAPEEPKAVPEALETTRCPTCGWIESTREISGGVDNRAIRTVEYTVRMSDGSTRTFAAAPGEAWRMRERMHFIDGSKR